MRRAALTQGLFYVATGLWPVLHLRSFEAVTGRKRDRWLVQTVGGLIAAIGASLLVAARKPARSTQAAPSEPDEWRPAEDGRSGSTTSGSLAVRTLGMASAATLAAADLVFVASGQIPRIYLADAAAEAALIGLWIMD